jgi:CheY-like chemotaxis protein
MRAAPTILLVEDNPGDRLLMQMALEKARINHSLQTVSDGEEAIDYLSGSGNFTDRARFPLPRLVLLDLNMPKRGGFDVLAWIAARGQSTAISVVVVSASEASEDLVKAYDLGARSFLVKPATIDELIDLVSPLETYLREPGGSTLFRPPNNDPAD